MFNNPVAPSSSIEEGSITEVDPIRKVCKVKTLSGQNLTSVPWSMPSGGASRAGDRISPTFGDRVIVDSTLGYPIISQFLPKLQHADNSNPIRIDTGEVLVDTGNFAAGGGNVRGDQNAPGDLLVGDRVLSSPGGGLVALLRAGTVLLRSSRFSEIFLSKLNDLVRISSRNFEHFTDVSTDVIRNIKGRIYRFTGYSKKLSQAKVESYTYNQYFGDVALAEGVKTDYASEVDMPSESELIFKEQVLNRENDYGLEVMKRELSLDGTSNQVISSPDGQVFTHIVANKDEIQITYKDINVIKINDGEISFRKKGDPRSIVITEDLIKATFLEGNILMDQGQVKTTYKDATVTMNDSGIESSFKGAVHSLDSSGVHSTFGGHFVHVTASGVSLG
jgi:hypothetical protein